MFIDTIDTLHVCLNRETRLLMPSEMALWACKCKMPRLSLERGDGSCRDGCTPSTGLAAGKTISFLHSLRAFTLTVIIMNHSD